MVMLPIIMLTVFAMTGVSQGATVRITAGGNHTVTLRLDGSLWAWGDNAFGQLGDSTVVVRNAPVRIGTDTTWSAVAAGFYHTVALKADGTLWTWGDNTKGQLGDGLATFSRSVPARVGSDSNWTAVAAGDFHTLALKTDGSLWAWGDNTSGQVGDGSVVPGIQPLPVQIVLSAPLTNNDWIVVAAGGGHSLARKANRTMWSWGFNGAGQIGNGTNIDARAPLQLPPLTNADWVAVAAGQLQSLALKSDGTLRSWGNNTFGQLGNGTKLDSDVPVQENSQSTTWAAADMGDTHTLGRKSDGTLWAWGSNANGQLGSGDNLDTQVPVKTGTDSDWLDAAAGSVHSVAEKTNGTTWTWGDNTFGQLGDGTNTSRNAPVLVAQARFFPKGDLNQNGVVDIADALIALRITVGLVPPTADNMILGDVAPLVNGVIVPNGAIDIADALQILRKVVGLITF
jgi:alpha-tubulin suppressor-like RCC1 family protein